MSYSVRKDGLPFDFDSLSVAAFSAAVCIQTLTVVLVRPHSLSLSYDSGIFVHHPRERVGVCVQFFIFLWINVRRIFRLDIRCAPSLPIRLGFGAILVFDTPFNLRFPCAFRCGKVYPLQLRSLPVSSVSEGVAARKGTKRPFTLKIKNHSPLINPVGKSHRSKLIVTTTMN